MFNIIVQKVESESDLEFYSSKYVECGGAPVSLEYLRNANVFLCKLNGKIIGGGVCNLLLPMRYMSWCTDLHTRFDLFKAGELTCVWVEKGLSAVNSIHVLARLYNRAHKVAATAGKDYIISGTIIPKLAKTQRITHNIPLYHGPFAPDNSKTCEIYASHINGHKRRIAKTYHKEFSGRVIKSLKRKKKN
jgi:hypothetical protein